MITVRRMIEEDVEAAAAIERALFTMPWSAQSFRESLALADAIYCAAFEDGTLAGYCGLRLSFDEAEITNVAVAAEKQGRGIGKKMLTELMALGRQAGAERFTLEVRTGNRPAIALYRSLGFEDAGIRPGFYEKPAEDALIMWTGRDR